MAARAAGANRSAGMVLVTHASDERVFPDTSQAESELAEAMTLWQAGHAEDARVALSAMTMRWPEHAEPFLYLGMVLLQQEDDANAERALAEAVRLAPNEGVIRFRHAEALTQLGRFEEAVSALVASIEASPTEARPYLALARMLEASGQHERAIAVLECELAAMTQDVRLQEEAARIRSAWNESSLNVQSTTS